jgi:hemoglobin
MSSRYDLRIVASAPERRARLAEEIAERTGIDDALIEKLVRRFYARAAKDPLIGPIFDRHVGDWEAHIARLCDFWSSVALMSGRYRGTPMAVHMPMPLGPDEFSRWLAIFAETADEVCSPEAAAHFKERALRIASSLELGVAAGRGEIVAPRRADPGPGA